MTQKTKMNWREMMANFFGMFGYFNVALQWLFLLIFSLPLIQSFSPTPEPSIDQPVIVMIQPETLHEPSFLSYIFVGIIVAAMIALSLYVLLRIPLSIVRSSHRIVEEGTEAIAPIVVRATRAKNQKRATKNIKPYISLAIKSIFSLTPLVLLVALQQQLDFNGLSTYTVHAIGIGLAALSCILFGLQYLIARLSAIRIDRLL